MVELEFQDGSHRRYRIQASRDLKVREDQGEEVYGRGETVRRPLPANAEGAGGFGAYRLVEAEIDPSALLPPSLEGSELTLRDDRGRESFRFGPTGSGVSVSASGQDPGLYLPTDRGILGAAPTPA